MGDGVHAARPPLRRRARENVNTVSSFVTGQSYGGRETETDRHRERQRQTDRHTDTERETEKKGEEDEEIQTI